MVNRLTHCFETISRIKYHTDGGKKFEAVLLKIFVETGQFEERETPEGRIESRLNTFMLWNTDKKWIVVYQPFGSQRHPDFMLILGGYGVWYIEAKSGTDNKATWNSGYPLHMDIEGQRHIYILNGDKDTTFATGEDLITKENLALLLEQEIADKKHEENSKKRFAGKPGITFVPSHCNMKLIEIDDEGKWFIHPLRSQREKNVFDLVRAIHDPK